MSIIQAMYSGSSALNSFGESMTVIGNNLANANTTAFKASSASFEDVLIQTVGTNGAGASTQVGTGVGLSDVQQDVTQGSFTNTTNVTDLSIDGRGFFIVKNLLAAETASDAGGPRDIFYTRAGDFKKDKAGDLVTPGGLVMQGWELSNDGDRIPKMTNINLTDAVNADPTPTSLVVVGANLDSSIEALSTNTTYHPDDPSTYDFSTSVRVFDSKGLGHTVEVQFRKQPMLTPATAVGGSGLTSASQGAGSIFYEGFGQTVNLGLDQNVQVNLTFTPTIGGVPGTPIIADPYFYDVDTGNIDTDTATVGGDALPLVENVTYNISYTTTKQEIGFDLVEEADVTLTFTPVNGNQEIVADSIFLEKGHHSLDMRQDVMVNGERISLTDSTRYKISYKTEPEVATSGGGTVLTGLVGDDSREEVLGVDNDNTWEWHAVVKTDELDQAQQSSGESTAVDVTTSSTAKPDGAAYTTGKLVFDHQGKLLEEGSTPLSFQFVGSEKQEILFDFGDATGKNGDSTNDFSKQSDELLYGAGNLVEESGADGGSGSLQVAGGFATTKLEQNGFPAGFLDKLSVSAEGVISGSYTNGQSKELFQIALVDFDDEAALEQKGSNLFAETISSGLPREGVPQSGRLGGIVAYSLEQSNVDMSGEFVRMITTQRGFQANSRIITVADGMMEELMALKR